MRLGKDPWEYEEEISQSGGSPTLKEQEDKEEVWKKTEKCSQLGRRSIKERMLQKSHEERCGIISNHIKCSSLVKVRT